jgi:dolichol-phosphate mannosyltransferase
MSVSIIIPCHDEEKDIELTVDKILEKINIVDYEIILINDFSNDNTQEVLRNISLKSKKIKIFENTSKGLGGAINKGIDETTKNYTCIFMADSSDDIEDLNRYYQVVTNFKLDAVLGSRFIKGSITDGYPKSKFILNRIFNYFVKIIFLSNYNDFTNAFKLYKTNSLKELKPIVSENFNIFLELPLKIISRNYKYKIIAINWFNRRHGKAKFKIKELSSKYFFTLIYCLIEKILLKKQKIKSKNN